MSKFACVHAASVNFFSSKQMVGKLMCNLTKFSSFYHAQHKGDRFSNIFGRLNYKKKEKSFSWNFFLIHLNTSYTPETRFSEILDLMNKLYLDSI